MADQKLTDKTIISTANDTDYIHVIQNGKSHRISKVNYIKELQADVSTNTNTIGLLTSDFVAKLAIADKPTEDGVYIASETGSYSNAGGLVADVDSNLTYIVVGSAQATFAKIEIPIEMRGDDVVGGVAELDALITTGQHGHWVITNDFTLNGNKTIPAGVIITFRSGVINGGGFTLTGNDTVIHGNPIQLFENTSLAGTFKNDIGYVEWFGAKGDGVTDDSDAFNDALTVLNGVKGLSKTYSVNTIDVDSHFDFSNSWLKYNGVDNGYCVKIIGNENNVNVNIDCDNRNSSGLLVTGDRNIFGVVVVKNNDSSLTGSNSNYGVLAQGDDNLFQTVRCFDFANTGNANGSFPQAFAFAGIAPNRNEVQSLKVKNCAGSALVIGSESIMNRVNVMEVFNCGDNGVYQLGGIIKIDSFFHNGSDEPIVVAGDGTMIVDEVTVFGECGSIFGIQNCKMLKVNSVRTIKDKSQTHGLPASIIRTRASNKNSGVVKINNIDCSIAQRSSTLFCFNVGTVDSVLIEDVKIENYYEKGTVGNFSYFNNIDELILKNLFISFYDMTSTLKSNSLIQFVVGAVTKKSYIGNINFVSYESDKVTPLAVNYRGTGFARAFIETEGVNWRTDIGPYALTSISTKDTARAAPTIGTWKEGKKLYDSKADGEDSVGWVCISGGTPGTWIAFGNIDTESII